jgi:hypothetical protein
MIQKGLTNIMIGVTLAFGRAYYLEDLDITTE